MARYYFHVRVREQLRPDEVGLELQDLSRVEEDIREVLLEQDWTLDPEAQFEVTDEIGRIVMVVPVSQILGPH